MYRIAERALRSIIRQEIIRSLDEAVTMRRSAGQTSGGMRRDTEDMPRDKFTRRSVTGIDDVIFSDRRDAVSGSPFIGGSEAFERTYNNGKLRVPMILKKYVPGGIEKFTIFVDAPAIKEDDIVVVPELLDSGELGAGVVTSIRRIPVRVGGREESVPVASIKFPAEARKTGVEGTVSGVGLAFLVRIGSFKTESGRDKMAINNSMRRKNMETRREEPGRTVKYSSSSASPDDDRRRDRERADFTRDMLGIRRR